MKPRGGPGGPGGLLGREFFASSALAVAGHLLGCVLERETEDGLVAVELTEVEAYEGEHDPASHAYRGRSARNAVMFGPPGHAYVYFTYGMHFCVNLVCLPAGTASAVLLRAGRVIEGADLAAARRSAGRRSAGRRRPGRDGREERAEGEDGPRGQGDGHSPPTAAREAAAGIAGQDLARGPARLCQALGIQRDLDGADVCDPSSPLRIRAGGGEPAGVSRGPRVGVAGGAERDWRFWLTGDPTVSHYRPHSPRRRRSAAAPPAAVSTPGRHGGTMLR